MLCRDAGDGEAGIRVYPTDDHVDAVFDAPALSDRTSLFLVVAMIAKHQFDGSARGRPTHLFDGHPDCMGAAVAVDIFEGSGKVGDKADADRVMRHAILLRFSEIMNYLLAGERRDSGLRGKRRAQRSTGSHDWLG